MIVKSMMSPITQIFLGEYSDHQKIHVCRYVLPGLVRL
jgi:hypothetical protein